MKKSQLKQIIKEQIIKELDSQKYKIMYRDYHGDETPSTQTFGSELEAENFVESNKWEEDYYGIDYHNGGEEETSMVRDRYYNPDDKDNYFGYSIELVNNELNENISKPLTIEEQKEWIKGRKQKRQELDNILKKSGLYDFKRK